MRCRDILKYFVFSGLLFVFSHGVLANQVFNVTLNTTPLIGHPAGPFSVFLVFTDGDGIGDANNTATISNFDFGGGNALGNPLLFGGASGSLETGVSITDSSFLSFFSELFSPGSQLSFSLALTSTDDLSGTPDRLTFYIVDNFGSPIPTLAPVGDFFLGADLGSSGASIQVFGSDPSRPLTVGDPVSIDAPTVSAEVPEPGTVFLICGALVPTVLLRHRFARSSI